MFSIRSLFVSGALLAALTTISAAQETPGRFTMKDIEGGILRMDTQTGQVSQCKKKDDDWVCETVADDRKSLEDTVAQLKTENEQLKAKVAEAEKAEAMASEKATKMPKDEELDRVMAFIEKFMRRFFDFAKSMRDSLGQEA